MATAEKIKTRGLILNAEEVRKALVGEVFTFDRPLKWEPYDPNRSYNFMFSGMEAGYYFTGVPSSGWVLYSRDGSGCWNQRTKRMFSPFADGSQFWVRETFWQERRSYLAEWGEYEGYWGMFVQYTDQRSESGWRDERYQRGWMVKRPSVHMREPQSRIDLEIKSSRPERRDDYWVWCVEAIPTVKAR